MIRRHWWWVCAAVAILNGCGGDAPPAAESAAPSPDAGAPPATVEAPPARPPGEYAEFLDVEVLEAAEYLAQPRFADADLNRGRRIFLQCRACHSLAADQAHKVGPNLHGVFGMRAASKEGFAYSDPLVASQITWTPAALEAWLVRPSTFIPGNRMAFAGIRTEVDRTSLIAYLLQETSKPPE